MEEEFVGFACVQKTRVYKDKVVSVYGAVREDSPERTIVITVKHNVNGAMTIEQITLSPEEFDDIVEVVSVIRKKMDFMEEVLL